MEDEALDVIPGGKTAALEKVESAYLVTSTKHGRTRRRL